MIILGRILLLWRARLGWLLAGLIVALASLAVGLGLMAASGLVFAGGVVLVAPWLSGLGVARVALRYVERLVTHGAMFRALADLRVWFFRGLARGGAGGLGLRQAGDVLARLVGDVEALDGLYLRVLLPLALALILLPALVVVIGAGNILLSLIIGVCS